jgi:hypothetical protein
MIRLVEPLNGVVDSLIRGEFVIVEYNSLSNIPLLPLLMCLSSEKSLLIEVGDKLNVKITALLEALKDRYLDAFSRLSKVPIINISNYPLQIKGLNVINIPLSELTRVMSKLYSYIKDDYEDYVIVINGLEQMILYFDVKDALREIAGFKVTLPESTVIGFLNYDVVDSKNLALIESLATTVIRLVGVVDIDNGKIRKIAYIVKTVNPVKCEMTEVENVRTEVQLTQTR